MKRRSRKKKVTRHLLDDSNNKITRIIICIFLMVSTFVVYSQIQEHEFLNYDDKTYITENNHVKSGLTRESIVWAFRPHASNWSSYRPLDSGKLFFLAKNILIP